MSDARIGYDTRRNRNLLERPSELEVGRYLLLQGGSAGDRAEENQVVRLDAEFCPPKRNSNSTADCRLFGRSVTDGRRKRWCHRLSHWCRGDPRSVLGVRPHVFTHQMKASDRLSE